MFRVHLTLPVLYNDGDLTCERTVELPFAPYPGLQLEQRAETDLMPQIESVFWDMREHAFYAVCHEEVVASDWEGALAMVNNDGWQLAC